MPDPSPLLPARPGHWLLSDPRHYQIAALGGLLAYGLIVLRFDLRPAHVPLILISSLLTQWAGEQWNRRKPPATTSAPSADQVPLSATPRPWWAFDPRSALISALSLCLLLRTRSALLAVAAGVLAISSKFLLCRHGKHLFNPTNFALVALLIVASPAAWVSPGQWGSVALFAFTMACVGSLVVTRARRADITLAFLAFHAAFLFGRSLSLGEPMTIPLHRMESGALLLFAFFMVSDPRSTPDSRLGRILFAALVAWGAWYVTFRLFRPNGLLWSLAACSLLTPAIDALLPGRRYQWKTPASGLPGPDPPPDESYGSHGTYGTHGTHHPTPAGAAAL